MWPKRTHSQNKAAACLFSLQPLFPYHLTSLSFTYSPLSILCSAFSSRFFSSGVNFVKSGSHASTSLFISWLASSCSLSGSHACPEPFRYCQLRPVILIITVFIFCRRSSGDIPLFPLHLLLCQLFFLLVFYSSHYILFAYGSIQYNYKSPFSEKCSHCLKVDFKSELLLLLYPINSRIKFSCPNKKLHRFHPAFHIRDSMNFRDQGLRQSSV